ncbi:hypothetical protein H2204_008510 [Knufia peltigerae]|uniref:Uncharacterized protein n=1 Tax=Knufia peltigerae TaxID=1002370 RepID=A0AA39CWU1_9EURO|nr:hypothetical protein H2204_008510 [Knufia peltigerae]
MASILERLFPVEQLEALGNKWPESAPKRRKFDNGASQDQQRIWTMPAPVRRQNSGSAIPDIRHHRLSTSSQQRGINPRYATQSTQIRRSNSESVPRNSPTPSASSVRSNSSSVQKSCLPAFIEPSLMQVYLHNLHPKDRSRYSLPGSPTCSSDTTTRPEEPRRISMASRRENNHEDSISSPGSLTTDTSSPQYLGEACTTPPASAGPFSDLIYGLRLTDHERGFMNDLLNPSLESGDMFASMSVEKRKMPDLDESGVDPANFFGAGNDSFQTMFSPSQHEVEATDFSGYEYAVTTNGERENDVHSSGLSPTAEEGDEGEEAEEDTAPAGIVMPVHAALSVDDFFDLEEAADDLSPLAI